MNESRSGQGDAYRATSEVAFLAEQVTYRGFVHNYKLNGKFIIPSLVPLMKSSIIETVTESQNITAKNTGNNYKTKVNKTNYLYISIPANVAYTFIKRTKVKQFDLPIEDTNLYVDITIPKNTEFIINFIGDDINKIRITGINDRGSNSSNYGGINTV